MQIQTYKEIYQHPVHQIEVPKELHNQPFEVLFIPLLQTKLQTKLQTDKKAKNTPNPALKNTVIIDDLSPLDNDWDLD